MKWITRARPKTDRIACPWLIRHFIDPHAEILYVPADQVLDTAAQQDARSFDAPGAEFDHRDGKCTFEVLIDDFDLSGDAALVRLAGIVRAADIDNQHMHDATSPCLPGLHKSGALGSDDTHSLVPGIDEQRGPFVLEPCGHNIDVNGKHGALTIQ